MDEPSCWKLMTCQRPKFGFNGWPIGNMPFNLGVYKFFYDGWHFNINFPFFCIYWGSI